MNKATKEHIIRIGSGNHDFNLGEFLPYYPTLRGSEEIFKISWSNSSRLICEQIDLFIKGLHKIEQKYKLETENEFGFGSPSPTYKLLKALFKHNSPLAKDLYEWINDNGGNYYIPSNELK